MWFGLQVILSCATTWVNYVATGPLQGSTHELRFPLVLCLVFFTIPLILECLRATIGLFKKERAEWLHEQGMEATHENKSEDGEAYTETPVVTKQAG